MSGTARPTAPAPPALGSLTILRTGSPLPASIPVGPPREGVQPRPGPKASGQLRGGPRPLGRRGRARSPTPPPGGIAIPRESAPKPRQWPPPPGGKRAGVLLEVDRHPRLSAVIGSVCYPQAVAFLGRVRCGPLVDAVIGCVRRACGLGRGGGLPPKGGEEVATHSLSVGGRAESHVHPGTSEAKLLRSSGWLSRQRVGDGCDRSLRPRVRRRSAALLRDLCGLISASSALVLPYLLTMFRKSIPRIP